MPIVFSLLVLAATVFAIVDIIIRDDGQVRFMPKALWLILVILLPLIGVILWFVLGRERPEGATPPARVPRPRAPRAQPQVSAPSPVPPRDTRSTEQQLADLEREIEEERLRAELRRQRSERGEV